MSKKTEFYQKQRAELRETNLQAVVERSMPKRISDQRTHVVLACMDERNTLTEEALGVYPSEVRRIATAGGMIDESDFRRLLGSATQGGGRDLTAYLVTHEVIDRPDLGCAAFKNDIVAQEKYFHALKAQLIQQLPAAHIHVVSMDTTTSGLRAIDLDVRDENFVMFAQQSGHLRDHWQDQNHAGFGIYVGEAYRAWHSRRNTFFHISACSPSLAHDLDIALSVILHHSDVDLSDKPIILHLDTPTSWKDLPSDCEKQMRAAIQEFLTKPEVVALTKNGSLQIISSTTNLDNWRGEIVES